MYNEFITSSTDTVAHAHTEAVVGHAHVFVFVFLGLLPFFPQLVVVLNEINHLFDFVSDVDALIFALFVRTSVVLQSPQIVQVFPRRRDDPFRTVLQEVIEQ